MMAATEASKNLPPGWRVEAFSGQRQGGAPPHQTQAAVDFRLIDPQGRNVPDYQDPKSFATYEKFAQDSHIALQKINPDLAAQHRWGGYFSGTLGRTYGAMDLMHQDVGGGNARMAAGQWETGLHAGWRKSWGVTDSSKGIATRIAERAAADREAADRPPAAGATASRDIEPTFGMIDFHKVRTTIDRDSPQSRAMAKAGDVTGKLSAEVVAPSGTKVTIMGTGAFKKTETTRRFTPVAARIVHGVGAPPAEQKQAAAGGASPL
jgi:hypothetical protein